MNSFAVVAFFAALAVANAGLLAGPAATVLQGPSSRSTLVGPEGSVISAVAPGGQVVSEHHSGVVAHSAPVLGHHGVVAHSAYAAPVLAHHGVVAHHGIAAPVVAHHAAYAAPGLLAHSAYAAPGLLAHSAVAHHGLVGHHGVVAHGALDTLVAGPSGSIHTSRAVASPLIAHHSPLVHHHGLYL